jgi:hypothetical protein
MKRRTSYSLTIPREVVLGQGLQEGDYLYYYMTNEEGRHAIVVYLDKKPSQYTS